MKTKKIISIIILTIIIVTGLAVSSFATQNSVEDENTNNNAEENLENNEDNTEENNQNKNENTDTENEKNDDLQNDENTNNNNDEDDNIESDDNKSNSENNKEEPNKNQNNKKPVNSEPEKEQAKDEEKPVEKEPTNSDNNIEEIKSDNADLKKLVLSVEGLSPEFNKDITEYYLIVDLSIEKIDIEAYPDDKKSIVKIDGNTDLQEGENKINITVKAESGDTKTYTINVTKADDIDMVNASLKNLSVKGFSFYPSFKTNIYNYNLTINEKISELEIIVEPEIEEATYEIIGNENLVEGDNLIKIIVTAKDGMAKREYKLNVFMSSKNVEIKEASKTPAIALLFVLSVGIVGTIVAISKKY